MSDKTFFKKAGKTGVLLIHGCGGTPVEMQYVGHGLYKAGFTVYCPQLSGHGTTLDDLHNSTWQDWYSSVLKAYYFLKQHCDIIIAGGLSAGATLALKLAMRNTYAIDGLLMYAPALVLNGWAMPRYMPLVHYVRPWMVYNKIMLAEREPFGIKDERVRNMIVNSMQSPNNRDAGHFETPLKTITQFNALSALVRKGLDNVESPMLLLHPKKDDIADISNSYEIIEKSSSRCELVVLDDSYHIITLDKQKNIVIDESVKFIKEIEKKRVQMPIYEYRSKHLRLV